MAGSSHQLRHQVPTVARRALRAVRDPHLVADVLGLDRPGFGRRRRETPLSHAQALQENGFTVFRGLFTAQECRDLAADFTQQAGITRGVEFTKTDATNRLPSTRTVVFDRRILDAVRTSLAVDRVRFLQPSDLHYLHDTAGWHRDSVHRAQDNSTCPDWSERDGRFGIVKAILYLESDNAAMGIMCGSHLSPIEIDTVAVKLLEKRHGQVVIDVDDEPNRRFTAAQKRRPMAWRAQPGDVLIFDQRMYHAGRRVDDGRVSTDRDAAKFTLSLVFGIDNAHSHRFYSYFRYARRELGYRDLPPDYRAALAEHDLLLSAGTENYYERFPQELRMVTLRRPDTMDELVAEFSRAAAVRET